VIIKIVYIKSLNNFSCGECFIEGNIIIIIIIIIGSTADIKSNIGGQQEEKEKFKHSMD
jgi:hypothetical protein